MISKCFPLDNDSEAGLDVELPLRGADRSDWVSASRTPSLVFDSAYGKGQRREVETLSSYARRFLDRLDRPRVEQIAGRPPQSEGMRIFWPG